MKDAELIYGRLLEEQEIAQVSGGGMTTVSVIASTGGSGGSGSGFTYGADDGPAMR